MVLGGEKIEHYKNCNMSSNLPKLIKFGVIVQNDKLHKTLDYFLSALIPFNMPKRAGCSYLFMRWRCRVYSVRIQHGRKI